MLSFKNYKVLRAALEHTYHPKLIALILWLWYRYSKVTFTSMFRKGDPGVHGTTPCRAADIRSWIYKDPEKIVKDINEHWIYDPGRPEKKCAILHDVGRGTHIHLQVHDNTICREVGKCVE